LTKEKKR